jgi:REP element-mobilizing transposase RayT
LASEGGKVSGAHGPRKRTRLPLDSYLVPGTGWLVTIGTEDRAPIFSDEALGLAVADVLITRARARKTALDAFCLMPDHAHLLIQITSDGAGLVGLISDLKSCTTRAWWAHGHRGPMWPRSFLDRGLRTMAAYDQAATYLLNNPVRAGLVEEWDDYPLIGGLMLEDNR